MISAFLRRVWPQRTAAESGSAGERRAAAWLCREKRMQVLARNWRNPRDRREEIDLICREGDVLVFVEVKTRASGALVAGYHAVDRRKRKVLCRAISAYLRRLRTKPVTFRFDVVEVTLPAARVGLLLGLAEVRHFENIPLFSKHFRG